MRKLHRLTKGMRIFTLSLALNLRHRRRRPRGSDRSSAKTGTYSIPVAMIVDYHVARDSVAAIPEGNGIAELAAIAHGPPG